MNAWKITDINTTDKESVSAFDLEEYTSKAQFFVRLFQDAEICPGELL